MKQSRIYRLNQLPEQQSLFVAIALMERQHGKTNKELH